MMINLPETNLICLNDPATFQTLTDQQLEEDGGEQLVAGGFMECPYILSTQLAQVPHRVLFARGY